MSFGLPVNNVNPIDYAGNILPVVPCVNVPRAPTTSDVNYPLFCLWRNANENAILPDAFGDMWYLAYFFSANPYQARWIKMGVAAPGDVATLTGDAGGAVGPDAGSTIFTAGATTTYVTGVPINNTLSTEVVSAANTFLYGTGPTTASASLGPLTDGQLIIGSSGNPPVASSLTAGTNITITPGAGSITIASTPPVVNSGLNLGLTLSAGIFTVTSADGTALSVSNPAKITLPSNSNLGEFIQYTVTADQNFHDFSSGTSTLTGNTWGVTRDADYTEWVPFYLYAVSNAQNGENTIAFAISRIPHLTKSPAAAKISKPSSGTVTTQGSMYLLPNVTIADYQNSPCVCLGSFRMTGTNTGGITIGDWTVFPFTDLDGIGKFNDTTVFEMLTGSFSNDSGCFFQATGGDTAPIFGGGSHVYYTVSRNGIINMIPKLAATVTAGVGTNGLIMFVPLKANTFAAAYSGIPLTFNSTNYIGSGGMVGTSSAQWYAEFGGTVRGVQSADVTGVCSIVGNFLYLTTTS